MIFGADGDNLFISFSAKFHIPFLSSTMAARGSLFLAISVLLGCVFGLPRQSRLSKHPIVIVLSLDGFRFDYMAKTETPYLDAIREEGVRVPYMEAQFPTKTFPNHQTMATGLLPDVHGITDNTIYDPEHGRVLSGFLDEHEFWNFHPDVLPFWLRNEAAGDGRYSGCFMWAGSSTGYGSNGTLFPTYYIPKYDENILWETRVETAIAWITHSVKPANFVFMYHNEPDTHGHSYGTDANATLEEIRRVDGRVGYLVEALKRDGLYDKVNLVIVSDHGMQTITPDRVMNTTGMVDSSLYARYGSSPVYHILPSNASDLDTIYNGFRAGSEGKNFTVFRKGELVPAFGFGTNRRIMDLVLLADPGYVFEDANFWGREEGGTHGYDNRAAGMRALFLARGPNFKRNFTLSSHVKNLDLVPLFSNIAGIPEPPHNGSFDRISSILV